MALIHLHARVSFCLFSPLQETCNEFSASVSLFQCCSAAPRKITRDGGRGGAGWLSFSFAPSVQQLCLVLLLKYSKIMFLAPLAAVMILPLLPPDSPSSCRCTQFSLQGECQIKQPHIHTMKRIEKKKTWEDLGLGFESQMLFP